jgi:uncharacterized protein
LFKNLRQNLPMRFPINSKNLIIIFTFFFVMTAFGQSQDKFKSQSLTFFEHLKNSDSDALYTMLDERVHSKIQKSQLAGIWSQLQGQVGSFISNGEISLDTLHGNTIVTIPMQFEKAQLNLRLSWNIESKVIGFFFLPGASNIAPSQYKTPEYAEIRSLSEAKYQFGNKDYILNATFTKPIGKTKFPIIILVHGSGPHDEDETIGPNKPFKDLSLGLASVGIATLRYEKRTFRYGKKMTTQGEITPKTEVIDDALMAISFVSELEGVDSKNIYLLGHSLGGMLAPYIASQSDQLAGIILLAANARPLEEVVLDQIEYLYTYKSSGMTDEIAKTMKSEIETIRHWKKNSTHVPEKETYLGMSIPYWSFLNKYDQVRTLKSIKTPALVIHAGRDYQVGSREYDIWEKALAKRKKTKTILLPSLNHLLMKGEQKSLPEEYKQFQNVDYSVISSIGDWVNSKK